MVSCCVASQFIQNGVEIQRTATENTCTDVTDVSGMQTSYQAEFAYLFNIIFIESILNIVCRDNKEKITPSYTYISVMPPTIINSPMTITFFNQGQPYLSLHLSLSSTVSIKCSQREWCEAKSDRFINSWRMSLLPGVSINHLDICQVQLYTVALCVWAKHLYLDIRQNLSKLDSMSSLITTLGENLKTQKNGLINLPLSSLSEKFKLFKL